MAIVINCCSQRREIGYSFARCQKNQRRYINVVSVDTKLLSGLANAANVKNGTQSNKAGLT